FSEGPVPGTHGWVGGQPGASAAGRGVDVGLGAGRGWERTDRSTAVLRMSRGGSLLRRDQSVTLMVWERGPWGQDVAMAARAGSMLPRKPGSLSMGSFMAKGRNQGPNRRRGNRHTMNRSGFPKVEFLEERQLLSGPDPSLPPPLWQPTST